MPTLPIAPDHTLTGHVTKKLEREQWVARRPRMNPIERRDRQAGNNFCLQHFTHRVSVERLEPVCLERFRWKLTALDQQADAFDAPSPPSQLHDQPVLLWPRFVQVFKVEHEWGEH